MSRFAHSLVLGKFYPPHAGHHHLIRTAAAACERTTVAVLASSAESIPLADRVAWLAAEHADTPGVAIVGDVDDHPMDLLDDDVWELHVGVARSVLARRAIADGTPGAATVDAVFSSEDYGEELAKRLGARHVPVDPGRVAHPVSGTAVRADPRGTWHHLAPATRAGLAARVVVVGAESTGTTTVSRLLAEHFGAGWVPERGRAHTGDKLLAAHALADAAGRERPDAAGLVWTVGDFVDVARGQQADEDAAAAVGGPLLVCDNDAWAATVWAHRYLGAPHPDVAAAVGNRRPHLYLLTDDAGVPFEQDGWRDGEHLRPWMTGLFTERLRERGVPWALLSGSLEARVARAVELCEELLREHFTFSAPPG
ncbi:AAA family ATPase [Umezawaea beigongshangensis]|uniref:AAA family ATPase n=1 Tax=Umezawaea beigongshangensis TaxID=2780383 RepID=UPI0018F15E7F|nr:AAA family ATPase [Umezawaea beigongshangensis]